MPYTKASLEKRRCNLLLKHGVNNTNQVPGVQEKRKQNAQKKYGVDNWMKVPENADKVLTKSRKTMMKLYGVEVSRKNSVINKKGEITRRQTMMKVYGVVSPIQVPEFEKKMRQSCFKNTGYDNPFKNRDAIKKSWLKIYGVDNPTKHPEIKKRVVLNCLRKGGTHPNGIEKKIIALQINGLQYTGDASNVISSGTIMKIPDFTYKYSPKVVEVFGDYWHSEKRKGKGHEENVIQEYKKLGYDCLIIWQHKINEDIDSVKEKIIAFLSPCRDYTSDTLPSEDIVRTA